MILLMLVLTVPRLTEKSIRASFGRIEFQMYADLYRKCGLGYGVIRVVSDRREIVYRECNEIGALNLRILKISMKQ